MDTNMATRRDTNGAARRDTNGAARKDMNRVRAEARGWGGFTRERLWTGGLWMNTGRSVTLPPHRR